MNWDFWIANDEVGEHKVLFVKHLVHVLGRRIDLHKFVQADKRGCFHSHPATAIRIVLRGGYVEELWCPRLWPRRVTRTWLPGDFGVIEPNMVHRIDSLVNGPSYSLWLRGPVTHAIRLFGNGYKGHPAHVED